MSDYELATSIRQAFSSRIQGEPSLEACNVVDGLFAIAVAINRLTSSVSGLRMATAEAARDITLAVQHHGKT